MAAKNISEIFEEYERATEHSARVNILRFNGNYALRSVLQGIFDPRVRFVIDELPAYKQSDAPIGMGYTTIHNELDRVYLFQEGHPRVSPTLSLDRKKQILIQMLEAMEEKEAKIFANMLVKQHDVKNLDYDTVKEAIPDILP